MHGGAAPCFLMPILDLKSSQALTGRPCRPARGRGATKVVRLRITPNFSYAGGNAGRRAGTRRGRRRGQPGGGPLCVWHRNAALRRTMLGEGKERKRESRRGRAGFFDMGSRKAPPAERARLANERARKGPEQGRVGLPYFASPVRRYVPRIRALSDWNASMDGFRKTPSMYPVIPDGL